MAAGTAVRPGTNVRYPGEDIAAGSEVFSSGTRLRAAHIGVLASLGIQSLLVCPRPAVGVLSTGSELAGPGGALVPGKIRDANRPALLAQLGADGFRGVDPGAGRDAGDHDVLKVALEKLGGATMRSVHVAVKPASTLPSRCSASSASRPSGCRGNRSPP